MQETSKSILYIITKSHYGGAQRYVHELAVASRTAGYTVLVASGVSNESDDLVAKLAEAKIEHYPIPSFTRDVRLFQEFGALRELRTILKKAKPDIVHLNSSKAGLLGSIASRLYAPQSLIVFTAHGWPFLEDRNFFWRSLAWFGSWVTALLSHRVIVVSENDLRHARMPLTQHFTVIHTAVPEISFIDRDEARRKLFEGQMLLRGDEFMLGTIAELTPNKNLIPAIAAVSSLRKKGHTELRYVIMGSGELENELRSYIHAHDLEGTILLLGNVPDARNYLKALDLFLLPSKKEGLPYAVLEAGRAGLPVVASNVGGIPEIIEHGVSGVLVSPTPEAIEVALLDLICSPEKRNAMGQKLAKTIAEKFNLQNMTTHTKTIYEKSSRAV